MMKPHKPPIHIPRPRTNPESKKVRLARAITGSAVRRPPMTITLKSPPWAKRKDQT